MSSTRGTTPKPIPEGVDTGLRGLGFKPVAPRMPGVTSYRHPQYAGMIVDLIAANTPGVDMVKVATPGVPVAEMTQAALIGLMTWRVEQAKAAPARVHNPRFQGVRS